MTDDERDRYLQGALRHAPDAQLGPAPALSDAILKEARAKARDPAPARPAKRGWLLALWDGLARPSVATGFAGVMVAVLVGVMWWDQPMDEALPRRPATAEAPVAAAPPAAEPVVPAVPAPAAPRVEAAPRPPAPKPEADANAAARRQEREQAATAARSDAMEMKKAAPADRPLQSAPPPAPAAAPVAPPEPSNDTVLSSPSPAADAARPAPAAAKARAAAPDAEAQRAQGMVAGRNADTPAALSAAPALREARAASPDRAALATLRATLAAEPAAWAWQRDNGPVHSMDEPLRGWLARLEASAGDAWQSRAPDSAAPRGRELRLLRDGRVVHSLRLTGNAVLWERDGSPPVQAALPSTTLGALQQALDEAAP